MENEGGLLISSVIFIIALIWWFSVRDNVSDNARHDPNDDSVI